MSDYHGSRRAPSATGPGSSQAGSGAADVCPQCGSAVRDGQDWCTLCLHVLRSAPPAAPNPAGPNSAEPSPAEPSPAESSPADADEAARRAQAEAAAALLLAQLANDPSNNALPLPPFLRSKSGMAVVAAGGGVVVLGLALLAMTVLGAITR